MNVEVTHHATQRYQERIARVSEGQAKMEITLAMQAARTIVLSSGCRYAVCYNCRGRWVALLHREDDVVLSVGPWWYWRKVKRWLMEKQRSTRRQQAHLDSRERRYLAHQKEKKKKRLLLED
jgi:hypothetical protein